MRHGVLWLTFAILALSALVWAEPAAASCPSRSPSIGATVSSDASGCIVVAAGDSDSSRAQTFFSVEGRVRVRRTSSPSHELNSSRRRERTRHRADRAKVAGVTRGRARPRARQGAGGRAAGLVATPPEPPAPEPPTRSQTLEAERAARDASAASFPEQHAGGPRT